MNVVVTGGADGIGRAIAQRFLADGARVHILDVRPELVAQARDESPGLDGSIADVADASAVAEAIAAIGSVDTLVNNAGIAGPTAAIEEIDDADWAATMSVNATGAFNAIRAVSPGFKARQAGVILNIVTTSVLTGLPLRLPYVASKGALMAMTRNVARELGPFGIRCNAILPGLIDNARGRRLLAEQAAREGRERDAVEAEWLRFVSMRCWIDPSEVGDMAVFLASPSARHVTGQAIAVCGGAEWE